VNPHVLALPLLALILLGCQGELGSEGALAPAEPALEAPAPAGSAAPAAVQAEEAPPVAAEMFVTGVDHPYFPMTPGTLWIYEGEADGHLRRDEVRILEQTRDITGIACTTVLQGVFLDGELSEVTTEWYAQDREGNVWKLGEESLEFNGERFATTADSWVAGEDGARPWMVFAAAPRVGDLYVGSRPHGQDELEVLSLTETVTVPAGTFEGCLQVLENADEPDDTDLIIYAPGVGLVSEQSTTGQIDLISIR
jgi:hypothetical protein